MTVVKISCIKSVSNNYNDDDVYDDGVIDQTQHSSASSSSSPWYNRDIRYIRSDKETEHFLKSLQTSLL